MIFPWKHTLNVGAYEYLRLAQTVRALIVNSAAEMSGVLIVLYWSPSLYMHKYASDANRTVPAAPNNYNNKLPEGQLSGSAIRPLIAQWLTRNMDWRLTCEIYHTEYPASSVRAALTEDRHERHGRGSVGVAGGRRPVSRFRQIIYLNLEIIGLARSKAPAPASKHTRIARPRASVDARDELALIWAAQRQTPTRRIAHGFGGFL